MDKYINRTNHHSKALKMKWFSLNKTENYIAYDTTEHFSDVVIFRLQCL